MSDNEHDQVEATRERSRGGIQSVEVGAGLLAALAAAPAPVTLTALAARSGMSASKAHKYLTSYVRVGLAQQDEASGRYELGSMAREMGFAALRSNAAVDRAQTHLDALRDRLDMTCSFAVWGNHGATIVRKADNRLPVTFVVQLGTVLPLLTSSNGRVFLAYLDDARVDALVAQELAGSRSNAGAQAPLTLAEVDALAADIRRHRIATTKGLVHPATSAISAPVFGHANQVVAAMTVLGPQEALDISPDGVPATEIGAAASRLSRNLGAVLDSCW